MGVLVIRPVVTISSIFETLDVVLEGNGWGLIPMLCGVVVVLELVLLVFAFLDHWNTWSASSPKNLPFFLARRAFFSYWETAVNLFGLFVHLFM